MSVQEVRSKQGLLCPVCHVDLVMTERQNIEVDYCPKCRGVWLDRGELDKIIEKSTQTPTPEYRPDHRPNSRDDRGREREYDRYRDRDYRHGSRRKSWLSEIFD